MAGRPCMWRRSKLLAVSSDDAERETAWRREHYDSRRPVQHRGAKARRELREDVDVLGLHVEMTSGDAPRSRRCARRKSSPSAGRRVANFADARRGGERVEAVTAAQKARPDTNLSAGKSRKAVSQRTRTPGPYRWKAR